MLLSSFGRFVASFTLLLTKEDHRAHKSGLRGLVADAMHAVLNQILRPLPGRHANSRDSPGKTREYR